MDPVSRPGRLPPTAKVQSPARQQQRPVPPGPAADAWPSRPLTPTAAAHVLRRIAAITSGEPQRRSEVLRAFLEGSLLDTFGAGALADPTFQQVVDEVHDTMRADGGLAAEVDRLVDRLLGGLESGRTRAELEAAFPPRPAAGP